MMYLTLGRTIREERERMEMSRAELARQVGVAPSQITRWEAGHHKPCTRALMALARALAMEPVELLTATCADAT